MTSHLIKIFFQSRLLLPLLITRSLQFQFRGAKLYIQLAINYSEMIVIHLKSLLFIECHKRFHDEANEAN